MAQNPSIHSLAKPQSNSHPTQPNNKSLYLLLFLKKKMSPSSQRPWYLRVPNSFRPSVIPDPKEFGVVFFLVFHSSTYLYYIILRNCALCGMKDNQIRGNLPLITSRKICPITTICRLGHRDSC